MKQPKKVIKLRKLIREWSKINANYYSAPDMYYDALDNDEIISLANFILKGGE
jgi:hypothetical protein